jgi:ribosomal protein S6
LFPLAHLFEGMFLIDNDRVRDGWSDAKSTVVQLLEKHGATVHTARRWDERALAYPIRGKRRATFLLSYFDAPGENLAALRRELEINDTVLRYLHLSAAEVPEAEREAAALENNEDFLVPPPPSDDAAPYRVLQNVDDLEDSDGDDVGDSDSSDVDSDDDLGDDDDDAPSGGARTQGRKGGKDEA